VDTRLRLSAYLDRLVSVRRLVAVAGMGFVVFGLGGVALPTGQVVSPGVCAWMVPPGRFTSGLRSIHLPGRDVAVFVRSGGLDFTDYHVPWPIRVGEYSTKAGVGLVLSGSFVMPKDSKGPYPISRSVVDVVESQSGYLPPVLKLGGGRSCRLPYGV
jgi:hypothetical protein